MTPLPTTSPTQLFCVINVILNSLFFFNSPGRINTVDKIACFWVGKPGVRKTDHRMHDSVTSFNHNFLDSAFFVVLLGGWAQTQLPWLLQPCFCRECCCAALVNYVHWPTFACKTVCDHSDLLLGSDEKDFLYVFFFLPRRRFTLVAMQREKKREKAKEDDTSGTRMDYEAWRDWNMHHVAYGERLSGDGVNNHPQTQTRSNNHSGL